MTFVYRGDFPSARWAAEKGLRDAIAINLPPSVAIARAQLAEVLAAEGAHDEALPIAREALANADHLELFDARVIMRLVVADLTGDAKLLADARALAKTSEDPTLRWRAELASRDRAALTAIITEAEQRGFSGWAAIATVELAALEVANPATAAAGRARLPAAIESANKLGLLVVVEKAQKLAVAP